MAFERMRQWFAGLMQPVTGGVTLPSSPVRQLWGRQFSVVERGLAEDQVVAYVSELMTKYKEVEEQLAHALSLQKVLQQAAVEADKVAAGIKVKAQEEAEEAAARIIGEAKQRAEGLITEAKKRAEALTDEEVRNILHAANRRAEIIETEAKQKAQLYLLKSREIIASELQEEVKAVYHRLLASLQNLLNEGESIGIEWRGKTFELAALHALPLTAPPAEEAELPSAAPVSIEGRKEVDITEREMEVHPAELEVGAAAPEEAIAPPSAPEARAAEELPQVREEKKAEEAAELPPKAAGPELLSGEVELSLPPPVDAALMSELSQRLQSIPEVKILRTVGSWERGSTITVALDKPLPLIDILSETLAVEASVEPANRGSLLERARGLFGGGRGAEVKRFRIVSKNQLKQE